MLISAFIAQGLCSELLEHCGCNHRIVASDFIFHEFTERLQVKFKFSEREATEAADLIRSIADLVEPSDLESSTCRDPDDDMILATAVAGNAACIITGDRDLLDLREFQGVDIIRPAEFMEFESGFKQILE